MVTRAAARRNAPSRQFRRWCSHAKRAAPARLGTATVHTDLSYHGHAFGDGVKVYLTERDNRSAQVGLKFNYTHEQYTHSSVSSHIEPSADHPAPSFTDSTREQSVSNLVTGNTYQMGVFIGI